MNPGYVSSDRFAVLIACAAGLLPLLGVNLAYWLAQSHGHVPSCFIYVEGCTSVSATGRQAPEKLVFQATMFPAAVLTAIYWYIATVWLALYKDVTRSARSLPWLGLVAALFLVLYSSVLGHVGDWYDIPRRIAVVSYLAVTFMAQLILTRRIEGLLRAGQLELPAWMLRAKVILLGAMLLLGLASVPAWLMTEGSKTIERILEWNFCVLLVCYYPVTAMMWRKTGFRLQFTTRDQ